MKQFWILLFFANIVMLLLFPISSLGQINDSPVKSDGELLFYFDTASFRGRSKRVYQEFYYQIPLTDIAFINTADGFIDTLDISFSISDTSGKQSVKDHWLFPVFSKEKADFEGRFLPDQFDLSMDEGVYSAHLRISDKNSGKTGIANLAFKAASFKSDKLILSDIQFASSIEPGVEVSKFNKNNYCVIPNPNRMFGNTLTTLFFYLEIYNLSPADSNGTYTIEYNITDLNKTIERNYPSKIKKKPGLTSLETGGIHLAGFRQPYYKLNIRVKDNDTGDSASIGRIFWNQRPEQSSAAVHYKNEAVERIAQMTDDELELHFEQMKYFLSIEHIKTYSELTNAGKRKFFTNFWTSMDSDPDTYENEFRTKYFNLVKYANEHFTSGFKEGWRTDQGRILIKFGIPDDRRQFPMTSNAEPYEEWYYYREEGKKFIFVDEEGTGAYRLIYSTDETEFTDPQWREIIGQ